MSQSYPPIGGSEEPQPVRNPSIGSTESRIVPPRTLLPQLFAAFSAVLGGLIMGTCIGWSGPVSFHFTFLYVLFSIKVSICGPKELPEASLFSSI